MHRNQTQPGFSSAIPSSRLPRRSTFLRLASLVVLGLLFAVALGAARPAGAQQLITPPGAQAATWRATPTRTPVRSGTSRGGYRTTVAQPTATRQLSSGESALLAQILAARSAAGLPALTLTNALIDLARDRSADMANRHYFDHYTPEGRTFLDMLRQRGIPYRMAGEIIAQNNYPAAQAPWQAYVAFMNSSEHHRIIMLNNWTQVGIGQAVDGAGMYYYTVLFRQP